MDASTPPIVGTGFELTLIASFEINTTNSAVTEITGIQLQSALPAMTVRVGGLGKMRFTLSTVAEFVLEGNFVLTAGASGSGISQSATFSGVLSANVGSVTLLKLNASGGLAIYADTNPGIAGTIQVTVNGDSQTGGSGFKFDGTFTLFVNTTNVARTVGSNNHATGPSVRLHVDGFMQLMLGGAEVFKLGRGTFDLEAGASGLTVAIETDVPVKAASTTPFTPHDRCAPDQRPGHRREAGAHTTGGSPLGGIGHGRPNQLYARANTTRFSTIAGQTGRWPPPLRANRGRLILSASAAPRDGDGRAR